MSDPLNAEFPKIASLKTVDALNARLAALGLNLRADSDLQTGPDAPMAQPLRLGTRTLGNRWCIHPMEGWDGTDDGRPSDWTRRRWRHFGQSGAKLIWGGEAVAVRQDGRANPHQLMINEKTVGDLRDLRELLIDEHNKATGRTNGLLVGLQLTHSGRFARPNVKDRLEPKILYRHPILDKRYGLDAGLAVVTDDWIEDLIDDFIRAACLAREAGYEFVDIKHCHGYLGHEFLSAHTRPGPYGGNFENRTRFLSRIVEGITRNAPGLLVCVRLSAFDHVPFVGGPGQTGQPADTAGLLPYRYGFGVNPDNPREADLAEPIQFVRLCRQLGVGAINVSCGSPYYNPHIQRPAAFPPSDGYLPPEDPLIGAARQIETTAALKRACGEMLFVGSGYSYLQDYLPHVAQWVVRHGMADIVGIGRMVLSYWRMPGDALAGRPMERKRICRTFSDCTTGPRSGLISGCFPLDELYGSSESGQELRTIKRQIKQQGHAGG
ncbi:MAG: NADPH dehydrogenase [Phycisphaerae bacterium]|nr:NADPH dehydrogenase [Phycisphaerae bacterium]